MLKIFVGFVIFAALAIFVIMQGGDSLDMGGEKHGADAVHAPAEAASAVASGASADASAAK
jgi:preprotein translocase subunit SecG